MRNTKREHILRQIVILLIIRGLCIMKFSPVRTNGLRPEVRA